MSRTVCLGGFLSIFTFIGPIGRALGLLPLLHVFTDRDLTKAIIAAGFEIEHHWRPGRKGRRGVFIVARKPR